MKVSQQKFLQSIPGSLPYMEAEVAGKLATEFKARKFAEIAKAGCSEQFQDDDHENILLNFLKLDMLLAIPCQGLAGDGGRYETLLESAQERLKQLGIAPKTSNLAHFYSRIYTKYAARLLQLGRGGDALWAIEYGAYLDRTDVPNLRTNLLRGEIEFLMGCPKRAFEHFESVIRGDANAIDRMAAISGQCRIAWLANQTGVRLTTSRLAMGDAGAQSDLAVVLDWDNALADALDRDDLVPLLSKIRAAGRTAVPVRVVVAVHLYAWGHQTRRWRERIDGGSLGRMRPNFEGHDFALEDLLKFFVFLNDAEEPFQAKMEGLAKAWRVIGAVSDPVCKLLGYAALARWLKNSKQGELAETFASQFANLSHALSQRNTFDLFGLLSDMLDNTSPADPVQFAAESGKVSGTGSEIIQLAGSWLETASTLLDGSMIGAKAGFRKLFGADQETIKGQTLADLGRFIQKRANSRRGVFVKLGQSGGFLANLAHSFLGEVGDVIQFDLPAMPADVVRRQVAAGLGKPIEQIFDQWNDTPIGVGSIGQVHRARFQGHDVAVKVRHPDVAHHMKWDVKLFQVTRRMLEAKFKGIDFSEIERNLVTVLLQETDYLEEARKQKLVAATLHGSDAFVTPRTFEEVSCRTVLVMDFIDGMSFDQMIERASQEEKNLYGKNLLKANYLAERAGIVHVDIHPDNFIFMAGGRIGFIDAGAVFEQDRLMTALRRESFEARLTGDMRRADQISRKMGIIPDEQADSFEKRQRLWEIVLAPIAEQQPFEFTPEYVELVQATLLSSGFIIPPKLFANMRYEWAIFPMLARMRAKADFRSVASEVFLR